MRIGEIARRAGIATSAIRFYERSGLLPEPDRTPGGYREYDPTIVERLAFIRSGQAVGLTLAELREVLGIRDRGEAPCRHVAGLIDARIADVDRRIDDLHRLRASLAEVAVVAAVIDPGDCAPDAVCSILAERP